LKTNWFGIGQENQPAGSQTGLAGSTARPGQKTFQKLQLIHPDSKRGDPYRFFDQLDDRNTMVKYILAFDKVGQTGLAALEAGLAGFGWVSPPEKVFSLSELQMR
jgi:hypothetical protein